LTKELTWPSASGITEAVARDRCTDAVQKAQLFTYCQHKQEMFHDTVGACMMDVLVSSA
jgi:hypothetical protein